MINNNYHQGNNWNVSNNRSVYGGGYQRGQRYQQNQSSFQGNNQLQQLLSQLLPLLINLINSLSNNQENQCDTQDQKDLSLSSSDKNKLSHSIYDGTAGLYANRVVDSVIDKDCSGDLSVGDIANVTIKYQGYDNQGNPITSKDSVEINQNILDKYNAL
mgnify:CR=1 FL=1